MNEPKTIERAEDTGCCGAAHSSARLWLCSEPARSDDGQPKPDSDDDGNKVTAKKPITAEIAAEIAVETSGRDMSDGDEMAVWVWHPGDSAAS